MISHAAGVCESAGCLPFNTPTSGGCQLAVRRDTMRTMVNTFPDAMVVGCAAQRRARAGVEA
jgi:hypothetical protein